MLRHSFDADYIERLAGGDEETERHFTSYFGELLSIKLRSRLRSVNLVDDVKQETFLRVIATLRKKGGITTPEALGAYVNTVCNNILFEIYRKDKPTEELPEDRAAAGIDAETSMVLEQERKAVRHILSELPEKDRSILRWIFLEERNKDEICRHFQVDREYLRVLLHRAKTRFRDLYLKKQNTAARAETNRGSAPPLE